MTASIDRLLANRQVSEAGCWIFTGHRDRHGYGRLRIGSRGAGRTVGYAHRIAYEALVGAIPAGLQLDHKCRVRSCFNPNHLEPVTQQENMRRGHVGICEASKTHCRNGHPYDLVNTYRCPKGKRHCRACRNSQQASFRARRAA